MGPGIAVAQRMRRMPRLFPPFWVLAAAVIVSVAVPRAQEPRAASADALKAAVEGALALAPRNYERLLSPRQAGVRVLDVDVRDTSSTSERITVDLSQRALTYEPSGNLEPLLETIIQA